MLPYYFFKLYISAHHEHVVIVLVVVAVLYVYVVVVIVIVVVIVVIVVVVVVSVVGCVDDGVDDREEEADVAERRGLPLVS